MKSQYFLAGAVVFCVLFFMAIPFTARVVKSKSNDLAFILENLRMEFPHSLNLGLNRGRPLETMSNFTEFTRGFLKERFIESQFLWIISYSEPGNSSLTVSLGNFLGSAKDITVQVGVEQKSVHIADGSVSSIIFQSVPSEFYISIYFDGERRTMEWVRDKVNAYIFVRLKRGEDIARLDIEA